MAWKVPCVLGICQRLGAPPSGHPSVFLSTASGAPCVVTLLSILQLHDTPRGPVTGFHLSLSEH